MRVPWLFLVSLNKKSFSSTDAHFLHLWGFYAVLLDYSEIEEVIDLFLRTDCHCNTTIMMVETGKAKMIGSMTVQGSDRRAGLPNINWQRPRGFNSAAWINAVHRNQQIEPDSMLQSAAFVDGFLA